MEISHSLLMFHEHCFVEKINIPGKQITDWWNVNVCFADIITALEVFNMVSVIQLSDV